MPHVPTEHTLALSRTRMYQEEHSDEGPNKAHRTSTSVSSNLNWLPAGWPDWSFVRLHNSSSREHMLEAETVAETEGF